MGTVGGFDFQPRTMSQAAVAAENQALASAKGRRIRCNRGGGSLATAECVAKFRAGQDDPSSEPNCSRDLGCSAGRMRAANFKEDDVTKSNYGKCVLCGRKGNRDSAGRCYTSRCKSERKLPADPLAMQESPILDDGEVAALDAVLSGPDQDEVPAEVEKTAADGVAAGQGDHIEDTRHMVAEDRPDHISQPGKMVEATPDHIAEPNKMVTNFAAPFSFGGFEFDPSAQPVPPGQPSIRLSTSGNLHISSAATKVFGLLRYKFVRITPDKTGTALTMIFSATTVPGARSLAAERKSPYALKASARQIARIAPAVVGKTLELRSMGQDGALLAVAVGEVPGS